ncbi:proliferation marker protein Ki-67 isoform X2 [Tupaia chinensis]|nr:proliferation marker protein Ki-67 isoform X2 [Tupaia chinensis]
MSLKRRRVSFGGRLRPELFDENLPPNTPLKRGETPTKRKSLVTHTPTVLKKIIKEQPQSSGKEESSEICLEMTAENVFMSSSAPNAGKTPVANNQRRRSCKASPASSSSKSPQQTDLPKRGGRKSGNLSSKRTSISRSQHDILQMICSKRRSGASEANLIVAKSWADVVKLGAKQTQTKVVKHGPPKQVEKKQKRPNTPKKPTSSVHNQFSTGHANSPCTIIIGKAHIEKANVPARPYKMLNNFVCNQKMDFKEDLSGLTEMFKTPVKEKTQMMSTCSVTVSNSENLPGKNFEVTNSEEKSLITTSELIGEDVFSSIQNAGKEPSDKYFTSPPLRQQCIKENENMVTTPRNNYNMTHVEVKIPGSETETLKTISNANKLEKSLELRNIQMSAIESKSEETKTDTVENILGRCLRKTPLKEKRAEEKMKENERPFKTYNKNTESKENSENRTALRRSRRTSELKCEPRADLMLQKFHETVSMKHLVDSQDSHFLHTPDLTEESMAEEYKTTKIACRTSQPESVNIPTSTKKQLKTPLGKVDVKEELSVVRMLTDSGETTQTHKESGDDDKNIKVSKQTPKQKLDPEDSVTGMKRWPKTPKEKTESLENLASFKELFQTPKYTNEPMTSDKITKIPCKSPQLKPLNTPTSAKKQHKISLGKVDVKDPSALRRITQTSEEIMHIHAASVSDDKDNRAFNISAKQKLEPAENLTRSKRWPRTPKENAQPLEDLASFTELFQTPGHSEKSMTDEKITKMSCKSAQPKSVNTPTSTRRRRKTTSEKVVVKEELLAVSKLTRTSGGTMHTPKAPVGDHKGTEASIETPKQKPDIEKNLNVCKRQPRTPKEKIQPLEDLSFFTELFQTPGQSEESMTEEKITKIPCKASQLEPVDTPTSTKRQRKTSLEKVVVREELSAVSKLTQTSGLTPCTPEAPVGDYKGIEASTETPKRKTDQEENLSVRKRWRKTPKAKAQPLEDLSGFTELFQTPGHSEESMTEEKITKISCISTQPEAVDTPTSTRRRRKTSLEKVVVKEELSVISKLTQTSGGTTHTPKAPAGDHKGIETAMETPKQKQDLEENVSVYKRRTRTPKEKAQPLEDLSGFTELFQTPGHSEESMTEEKITKIPCKPSQLEPMDTPTSTRRRRKISLEKMVVKEELSVISKLTQTSGGTTHTPKAPAGDHKGIETAMETPKQKQDLEENVSVCKRQTRTPKEKAQPLKDLSGFTELFQTPGHSEESMTEEKITKIPCKPSQLEPMDTPTNTRRQHKTSVGKLNGKGKLSEIRGFTRVSEDTTHTPKTPVHDDKGFKASVETAQQKLNPAENLTGNKRSLRTPKEKAQPLENLAGFTELFQTPGPSEESVTDENIKVPCQSAQPEAVDTPIRTRRWQKTSVGKVVVKEELSEVSKLMKMSGENMHTPKAPVGDYKDTKASMEILKQKPDLEENVSVYKRQPRTPKEKAQSLEDLSGFTELFQTPGPSEESMTGENIAKISCKSVQTETLDTPISTKRRHKTSLEKVIGKEELSAIRRFTRLSEDTTHALKAPVGNVKGFKASVGTAKQKLDAAENLNVFKRRPRTPKEKVQPLEDLDGFIELFQTPDHPEKSKTDEKITKLPCKSTQPESVDTPTSTKRRCKTSLEEVVVREELSAVSKLMQISEVTTHAPKAPVSGHKGNKASMETPKQKPYLKENLSGHKRSPRTPKEKTQPLEDLSGFTELFQTPHHSKESMTDENITEIPYKPLEPVDTSSNTKRRCKTSLQKKVVVKDELSAIRELTHTTRKTTRTRRVHDGDNKCLKSFKELANQKLDPATNVTPIKRRLRTRKETTQTLKGVTNFTDLFQSVGHSEESVTDGKTSEMPCKSAHLESANTPTIPKRQLKTSVGKVVMEKDISALRKQKETGKITHTHKAVGDDKGLKVFEESAKQKLDTSENLTGSKRRPKTHKEKTLPLKDLVGFREATHPPHQAEELRNDADNLKSIAKQTPNKGKPLKILTRVLRAPKVKPMDTRDPVKSQSKSDTSLTPKQKCGKDGRVTGTKRVCWLTTPQKTVEENSINKRQRTESRKRCKSPEPLVIQKKRLRISEKRTQPVEDPNSNNLKTEEKEHTVEDLITPDKGMFLRTRRQTKTNVEQQRPEFLVSAEKMKIKGKGKSIKTSQETELQNPEDAAKKPMSRGKVSENRVCLRSGRQKKIPQPNTEEEKEKEKTVKIAMTQKEKAVTENSNFKCLRSRQIKIEPRVNTLESKSEQRVPRSTKRHAENPKEDKDTVCIKKIRTRRHRDSKEI